MMDIYSLIEPYLTEMPWLVQKILAVVLPSILTAAVLGKVLKPLLRKVVTSLKEKTPANLWPVLGAAVGVVLQLIAQYLGVNITPGEIGWELVALGVATGGVGAPVAREIFWKAQGGKPKRMSGEKVA